MRPERPEDWERVLVQPRATLAAPEETPLHHPLKSLFQGFPRAEEWPLDGEGAKQAPTLLHDSPG